MAKLERVPFEDWHAAIIEFRPHEAQWIERNWIVKVNTYGTLCTYIWEYKILAIVGYYRRWKGVAQVFVIPSIYVDECPKSFVKAVKEGLERIYNDLGFHRLQTESLADAQTTKWMELLGFQCEGRLRKYTSGQQDYNLWAMVR